MPPIDLGRVRLRPAAGAYRAATRSTAGFRPYAARALRRLSRPDNPRSAVAAARWRHPSDERHPGLSRTTSGHAWGGPDRHHPGSAACRRCLECPRPQRPPSTNVRPTGHRGCPSPDSPGYRQGGGRQPLSGLQSRRRRPDAGVRARRCTGVTALYPPPRRTDARGCRGLPDRVRPAAWRGRRSHRRPAFHSGSTCGPGNSRRASGRRYAPCRDRHLPAGTGRPHRRPPYARGARRNYRCHGRSD